MKKQNIEVGSAPLILMSGGRNFREINLRGLLQQGALLIAGNISVCSRKWRRIGVDHRADWRHRQTGDRERGE
jgi:hypothetical protein